MRKSQLILLSGFLGSGKTTLMLSAADTLRQRGLEVACVTNDQGQQLVDSKMVLRKELPLQQIQGGCFCCRFEELVDAINEIIEHHGPDVILAEAVGSCTDLTATVIKPLQARYGELLEIRPLSVVVDPGRLKEMMSQTTAFTKEIAYLFEKQLEEAGAILLNKTDLLSIVEIDRLRIGLQTKFDSAHLLHLSALTGRGLSDWLDYIMSSESVNLPVLDIDYDIYAEGEAQLGWLNASITLNGPIPDVGKVCISIIEVMLQSFRSLEAETAHLKLWAQDLVNSLKMSAVHNQASYRTDHLTSAQWQTDSLTIWVNARVNIGSEQLREIFFDTMRDLRETSKLSILVERMDCFAPNRPVPTYRMA
jgi:Ni2+-binding GTPase involved in maturation of urease and hydrogenase